MSRNIRQLDAHSNSSSRRRRRVSDSSTPDLTDTDGYSAVDEISDSEDDDEEDVVAAEEEHIISNALRKATPRPPRPLKDSEDDDDNDQAIEDSDEGADDADAEDENGDDDNASWNGFLSDHDETIDAHTAILPDATATAERRVRFADDVPDPSSDSDSTDTDNDELFPDIFVAEAALDPRFRREIARELELDQSSNDSYWDLSATHDFLTNPVLTTTLTSMSESETSVTTPHAPHEPTPIPTSKAVGPPTDDEYDSDDETTDEDVPIPVVRKHARRVDISETDVTDSEPIVVRKGQPRVARVSFDRAGERPIALFDPKTKKMVCITPQTVRHMDSMPDGVSFPFFEMPANMDILSSPPTAAGNLFDWTSPGAGIDATLASVTLFNPDWPISNTFGGLLDNDISSDDFLEEVDEAEKDLNIEDFVAIDEDSDDEDGKNNLWSDGDAILSTPAGPNGDTLSLFDHFDSKPDVVGAFRLNQINSQLIASDKATAEGLAFVNSNSFHQGPIRGIKTGRIDGASVLISPERRKRARSDIQSSPLANAALKRKAPSDPESSHKKQRSISEVKNIQL